MIFTQLIPKVRGENNEESIDFVQDISFYIHLGTRVISLCFAS
jgi:hypothetical protein